MSHDDGSPVTGPDPGLGDALRRLVEPSDTPAFTRRVMARIVVPAPVTPLWGTLSSWARAGIPAALAVAAGIALFVLTRSGPAPTLEEALVGSGGSNTAQVLASQDPPGASLLFDSPETP
jgi:hypothetical protein